MDCKCEKMTIDELKALIAGDETKTIEMKKTTGELKDAMHSACAFLNTNGGWLIFGITPVSLKILGQNVTDATRREMAAALRGIEPRVNVDVEYVAVPDREDCYVIALHFGAYCPGSVPYTYDGCPYWRQESTTERMPRDVYDERLRESRSGLFAWENRQAQGVGVADLSEERILGAVRAGVRGGRVPVSAMDEPVETILKRWGLLAEGKPNNAAVALFAGRVTDYPQMSLRMARFRGTEKLSFIDNQRAEGNIYDLLDAGMAFCFKHLNLSGEVRGLVREEHLEIPQEALREALINALAHRTYDAYNATLSLGIYDDRVEITNPGRFPVGVTPENIKSFHESRPMNQKIAQVLYRSTYLESWGTGIGRMVDSCVAAGLPEPEYGILSDGTIVLTFRKAASKDVRNAPENASVNAPVNASVKLSETEKRIMELLKSDGYYTYDMMSEKLSVNRTTIMRNVQSLVKKGLLRRVGADKNGYWEIK